MEGVSLWHLLFLKDFSGNSVETLTNITGQNLHGHPTSLQSRLRTRSAIVGKAREKKSYGLLVNSQSAKHSTKVL
jgi:hypothetical protein